MTNLNWIKTQKLFTLKIENIPNPRYCLLKIDYVFNIQNNWRVLGSN